MLSGFKIPVNVINDINYRPIPDKQQHSSNSDVVSTRKLINLHIYVI